MKARIISCLNELAKGTAPAKMVVSLMNTYSISEITLQSRSRDTLRTILHGYSYFSVNTIDSFFQRVVTTFARDLGIQGGFTLEFELKKVVEDLIDRMFMDLSTDNTLRDWLIKFTEARMEDNKNWDIRYEIRPMGMAVFMEQFQPYLDTLSDTLGNRKLLTNIIRKIQKERAVFEKRLKEFGNKGLAMLKDYGLTTDDLYYANRGPGGLLFRMAHNMEPNLNSSFVSGAYESKENWLSKKSVKSFVIQKVLDSGLYDLYRRAIDFYKSQIKRQTTYKLVLKLIYNLGIYANLIRNLKDYRTENDVLLISDLAGLLQKIIGENDAPYIYEKVGNFYQHFLIDEFQDTSSFQWQNFKPLVRNAVAGGQYNMLVGDVKQSIYRWRGGNWQILQDKVVGDIGEDYLEIHQLNLNWRSRNNIVAFNNTVFAGLPEILYTNFRSLQGEVGFDLEPFASRFTSAYLGVMQDIPGERKNKNGGYVKVRFIEDLSEDDKKISWKEQVMKDVVDEIQIIQDKGYPLRDIGILVRSGREGKEVADHLLEYKNSLPDNSPYHFDVISSESLFLSSSPSVNAAISFMKLVRNEKDTIAIINLFYWISVLREDESGTGEIYSKIIQHKELKKMYCNLLNVEEEIIYGAYCTLPLNDLLEIIVSLMQLEQFEHERPYITGLRNTIIDYLNEYNGDLNSFLDWWEREGRSRSIKPSAGTDAIQIMTIHQAKGLQFEFVFVPFCNWEMDPKSNSQLIWCSSDSDLLKELGFFPVKYENALAESELMRDYYEEKSLSHMDNLNLLYVALTRAMSGLFVYAPLPKKVDLIKYTGNLLFNFFQNFYDKTIENEDKPVIKIKDHWDSGNGIFSIGAIPSNDKKPRKENKIQAELYAKGPWYDKISIRKQPDRFTMEEGKQVPADRISYGNLLHDILSRIYYRDMAGKVLQNDRLSGYVNEKEYQEISVLLDHLWKNERINEWFSRNWLVKTEVPVLPRSGAVNRMDRVMIRNNKAVVIDYKTGIPRIDDKRQVTMYKEILQDMGYNPVEGYLLYLADIHIEYV